MCVPGTEAVVRARMAEEGPPRPVGPRLTRRHAMAAAAAGAVAALAPAAPARARSSMKRVADLSHVFRDDFPLFPGAPPTSRQTLVTVEQNGFYGQQWTIWEHAATHIDAPGHFIAGGRRTPQLTVEELVAPMAVVDISADVARDPDTAVTVDHLRRFERRHGRIARGSIVCMHSGWESRAGDPGAYLGTDGSGVLHFPGFSGEAVAWLLAERAIGGIGVDTLSLDPGPSSTFDAHLTLLGADRIGVENLRNLKAVPARGANLVVGVIPWEEGSGGPCRALALW
jgi:kynurenine formamidase